MGTQKAVVIGEDSEEIISGPIADHHGKKKPKAKSEKVKIEDKIKSKKFEKVKEVSEDLTPEVPEVDNLKQDEAENKSKPEAKKDIKPGKAKLRSKKYKEVYALVDQSKKYPISEALELAKKTSRTKFDGNIEVHSRILSKNNKPEALRGTLKYPHATGKIIKVMILDEKIAAEIEKTGKADADIYIATAQNMPKIAKLAKIFGPKGKMPNPKSGTISADPEKTKTELESGQVEYKTDKFGNLHQVIGKVSAESKMLEENYNTLISVLPKDKISILTISATMGPSIKVQM